MDLVCFQWQFGMNDMLQVLQCIVNYNGLEKWGVARVTLLMYAGIHIRNVARLYFRAGAIASYIMLPSTLSSIGTCYIKGLHACRAAVTIASQSPNIFS